jgi:DNA-binding NarL/FixJ family response regulator
VRTWRRAPASPGDGRLGTLSGREREIAQLVARGASNPEIAAAVFLSRKTVERHLSNIYAKAGVRNRAELAALAADESTVLGS